MFKISPKIPGDFPLRCSHFRHAWPWTKFSRFPSWNFVHFCYSTHGDLGSVKSSSPIHLLYRKRKPSTPFILLSILYRFSTERSLVYFRPNGVIEFSVPPAFDRLVKGRAMGSCIPLQPVISNYPFLLEQGTNLWFIIEKGIAWDLGYRITSRPPTSCSKAE